MVRISALVRSPAARTLGAAILVVLGFFLSSNAYVAHRIAKMDRDTSELSSDLLPRVRNAEVEREALHDLLFQIDDAIETLRDGGDPDVSSIRATMVLLEKESRSCASLHVTAASRSMQARTRATAQHVQTAAAATLQAIRAGDLERAESLFHALRRGDAQTLESTLMLAMRSEVASVRSRASEMSRERRVASRALLLLDLASLILVIPVALLGFSSMHAYESTMRRRQLRAEERADDLDAFAARVAHDIHNPLGAILVELGMIARRLPPDADAARAAIERARRAADRVIGVTDGMLQFARAGAETDAEAHADPSRVLDDLLRELARDIDAARAVVDVERAEMKAVVCPPDLLGVIFANLLRNALKYLGDAATRRVVVRARDRGPSLRIEVEDSGPGVPEAVRTKLFRPYVRAPGAREPGLGLGLATVKRICERYKGRVGVRPAPRGGSIFWVELPVCR